MLPSEILDNAANIILRDGWHQGTYYKEPVLVTDSDEDETLREAGEVADKTAPCCQEGAINRATIGYAWLSSERRRTASHEDTRARDEAVRWMRRHLNATSSIDGDQVRSAVSWNDHPDRTVEEVVEALRGAAELARSRGEWGSWSADEWERVW